VETNKWQTELPVAVWLQRLQARVCGLSLQPACPPLSVTQQHPQQLQFAFMWRSALYTVGLYLLPLYA